MNILCIEDDKLALDTLETVLKNNKEVDDVFAFDTGFEEVFEYVKDEQIDIAILDVHLQDPKFDGISIANKIHELSPNTYIIFSSDYKDSDRKILRNAEGQKDYLEKPWTKEKIETKIKKVIEKLNGKGLPPKNCPIVIKTFGTLQIFYKGENITNELRLLTQRTIAACINDFDKTFDRYSFECKVNGNSSLSEQNKIYDHLKEIRKDMKIFKFLGEILEINSTQVRFKSENTKIWCDLLEYKKGNYHVLRGYNHEYLQDLINEDTKYSTQAELEEAYRKYILNE